MELYEKIRNIREQKEIKQKDMAKYLHMQPSTYNAYENGKRTISADLLKNICIFLNVSSDDLLDLNHNGKVIIRMSVNPEEIINKVEFGTSRLKGRIDAINKLADAGYKVGILIAPVILVDNWKELYRVLIERLNQELSDKVKKSAFFEIIFMTYSYVHTKINPEAFPNAINLFDKEIMTGRGNGKYAYKMDVRKDAEIYLRELMEKHFAGNSIEYIV